MKKICIIFGTRPEIIKLHHIIKFLKKKKHNFFLINSNQHYNKNMSSQFLKEFKISKSTGSYIETSSFLEIDNFSLYFI